MQRLSVFLLSLLFAATLTASPTQDLNPVGSATLKVLFWTIYDSSLFTPNGIYEGVKPGLALQINYRRNISRSDLIDRTRDEWQKLDLYQAGCEEWLSALEVMWPDLKRGDELVLHVDEDLNSNFFFNDELIGSIKDSKFTENFLAIWLSENSSYPRLRNQLVGLRD
ncbi:MAG: chalcone isomerase family protein [Pseudomonadales bacterium]|nr:chalcone isomerase family protein [Pseudomonadales bacterium]